MSNKKYKIHIDIQPSLNRGLIYSAFPIGKAIQFSVLFHKMTSALQFQIDSNASILKNKEIIVKMFRNLETCKFTNTFFDLETVLNDRCDFRCKFLDCKRHMNKYLVEFMNEKIDLHVVNSDKSTKNYIMVRGWKILDLCDDLLFFFVQRRCYNNVTRTNIIRTAGLQFSTEAALDILDKYSKNSNKSNYVVSNNDIPDFFRNDRVVVNDVDSE